MIDMHVHILPGVDDGAKDEKMSREMIRRAADLGITQMIATPHVYRMDAQIRNMSALPAAQSLAKEHGVTLYPGCEFNYRVLRETGMDQLDSFCLAGTKCLLLEFSDEHLMPRWDAAITEIMDNGYLPIIAHPERYRYIQRLCNCPGDERSGMRNAGGRLRPDGRYYERGAAHRQKAA